MNKKDNLFLTIIKAPVEIVKNLFIYIWTGLKFCFYDIFIIIYNFFRFQITKTYTDNTKNVMQDELELYEKTKKVKKEKKVKKYSKSYLKKLKKMQEELKIDLQRDGATRSKIPHIYYFIAKDQSGKIIKDTINGYSKLDVNAFLINEGYEVYCIKTSNIIDFLYKDSSILGKSMSMKDLIFWLTQLSTYLKAGLNLSEAVKVLNTQMKGNRSRKRAFEAISYELLLGESFSNAMEKQGKMFPPLLINMIKAAEASGTLIETLDDLADYYTDINDTRKQMISALTYPLIISIFSILVITFILVFIVPRFNEIYAQQGQEITGLTKVVMNISNYLKNNGLMLLGIIFLVIIVLYLLHKYIKSFKTLHQYILMHLPLVKNIIIYNEMTIFAKTFSSLLKNNVFITDSIGILSKVTNNEIYRSILYKTINNIIKGEKISEAFKDHWAIPDVAYYMIVTGESTGDLSGMMEKVSEYYQTMHKSIINNLKAFIEPIMITILAFIVGIIIISVIVPMFGMYDMVG